MRKEREGRGQGGGENETKNSIEEETKREHGDERRVREEMRRGDKERRVK